jgi:formamidopyrimidine-DNA glycosylase
VPTWQLASWWRQWWLRLPEGPEVETVRRGLHELVVGRTIVSAVATGRRSVRRYGDGPAALAAFNEDVTGLQILGTGRRGKYLWLDTNRGALVVHLRMSGQVLICAPTDPYAPHTHVVIALDDGSHVRFIDPRTFGELWRSDDPSVELAHIGPDAVEGAASTSWFVSTLRARRSPVKTVLLDQGFVAGIGNIYSDEICHLAGVRPMKRADTISKAKATLIAHRTIEVLERAISLGGSSLRDAQYVDVHGQAGSASSTHRVYDRVKQGCGSCGGPITKTVIGGRSSHWCRTCQRM